MSKWYEKSGECGNVVISTRVRLARNLNDYPFPCKMTSEQRHEVAQKVHSALVESNSVIADDFEYIDMNKISKIKAASLVEKHLISPIFTTDTQGKYLLLSKDESISIMINEEDHLRIQVMESGLDLEKAYDTADKIDTLLDNALQFAFHDKLGYLTQCPTNLGTGLRASLMLHLPALQSRKTIGRLGDNLSKIGLALRGIYGEGSKSKGAIYQLSNQVTLGLSEQLAMDNLKTVAQQIINQEINARKEIIKNIETVDYIMRSLGTLKYARLLSSDECMNLLSALRFGVSENIIDGISLDTVNRLFTDIQSATLMENAGQELNANQRDEYRAKEIKKLIG